jgi:outer membrane protein OmpA-like peptidoglycan-associated protein
MKLGVLVLLILTAGVALAAEPQVVPAADLAKKWKRTKSLAAPVEKVRKGLEVEVAAAVPVEVKVDGDTAMSFQNIQFALDSAELMSGLTGVQIAEIARAMAQAGTERFLIEGHTCDLGAHEHNLALSQQRALAVKTALVNLGVDAARLQVMGFGQADPVAPNTDEAARARNRRVQIFRKL